MLIFTNAHVVLPDRVCPDYVVVVDGDRVVLVGEQGCYDPREADTVVDCEGGLLGPGFVDIHCHAGGDAWFHSDPAAAAAHQLRHGTTTVLATTISMPHDELVAALARIAAAIDDGTAPSVRGIHMEGPYLSRDHGAHRSLAREPQREEYEAYARAAGGWLRTMTVAPEVAGTARMVADLQVLTGGAMVFSVGHSGAGIAQIRPLVASGLRLATHVTDATGCPVTRYAGTRELGVDESVLLDDAITAELVVDSAGAHVRPEMAELVLKVKGVDRVALVTDATAESGDAADRAGGDVRFNPDGELAGSSLTMDRAVRNLVRQTGRPLVDAWRCASHTPAAAHGWLADLGWVAPGRRADLLLLSHELDVRRVWLGGVEVDF